MKKRIALIFHENERKHGIRRFAIWHLANLWRMENLEVVFLFGTAKFIPADVALLHVDLTVVPEEYVAFAGRYPVVLNGKVTDIRKSSFSGQKVNPEDGYEGPVIVKSEMNYAGQPERKLLGTSLSRLAFRISCRLPSIRFKSKGSGPDFRSPSDYVIYDSPRLVPREWFSRNDILVEKFIPEMHDGLYCQRVYHFLGDRGVCIFREARHPIVNNATVVSRHPIEVHPEIVKLTKTLQFDYGKFDYVLQEGKPMLLDANKTPGGTNTPRYIEMCREWAKGIHAYL